jgi:hypothetical protein
VGSVQQAGPCICPGIRGHYLELQIHELLPNIF